MMRIAWGFDDGKGGSGKEEERRLEGYNILYYRATSTGCRRALLLLKELDMVVESVGALRDGEDERYVLKRGEEDLTHLGAYVCRPLLEVSRGVASGCVVWGRRAVSEYIGEKYYEGKGLWGDESVEMRAFVRTFVDYLDGIFEEEIVVPFLRERLGIRGDGEVREEVDVVRLREVRNCLEGHLNYLEYRLRVHSRMVGKVRTFGDVACSASLTLLDYLGEIDWSCYESLYGWYRVQKPFCKVLLGEYIAGVHPPEHYNRIV